MKIEKMLSQIEELFPEKKVCVMLDDEIPNWLDEGWEEDFENEFEAYNEAGRREAEDAIIEGIINSWVQKYNDRKELDTDSYLKLYEKIEDKYEVLK